MNRLFSKARNAATQAHKYLKRNSKVRSLKQAASDYAVLLSGLGSISVGAFTANVTAGWIVMGILAVMFNERISS